MRPAASGVSGVGGVGGGGAAGHELPESSAWHLVALLGNQ
jgi:hypothetical protein